MGKRNRVNFFGAISELFFLIKLKYDTKKN